jgi:hypothetical protein
MPRAETDNPALLKIREQRGLAVKLGKKLGLSRSAVWMWKTVPPKHAVVVARALRMPVHRVCPSIFPAPKKAQKKKTTTRN